jgi:hypothetical protein
MPSIDGSYAITRITFCAVALLVVKSLTSATAQTPPAKVATEFDGLWQVIQDCSPHENMPGYHNEYQMVVQNGFARARWGTEGAVDSLLLNGQIRPDGTATMVANGLTGRPRTPAESPAGTFFGYTVSATFFGNKGVGNRKVSRPCTFTFAKQ